MRFLAEMLFPAEAFVEGIEIDASGLGDDDHVFDANSAEGFAVEPWFDGHHIACDQLRTACGKQGWLVDFEPKSMSGSVGHAGKRVGSVLGRQTHLVPCAQDRLHSGFVDRLAGHSGANGSGRSEFRCDDGAVHRFEFRGHRTVDHGSRAIAVVEVGFDSWKYIDDHGLFGEQRTVTMVVAIGADGTAGDDRPWV